MKAKTPCQCCLTPVFGLSKRFDASLGFICADCFTFIGYAETQLTKIGIEGHIARPVRHAPKPEIL